jgi:hypothetical protein
MRCTLMVILFDWNEFQYTVKISYKFGIIVLLVREEVLSGHLKPSANYMYHRCEI